MYENTGRLFKNDKKEPDDKRPDYTGDFTDASGTKMRLAAWLKDSDQGGKWMSLKVSEMQQPGGPQQAQQTAPDLDDEIPF